MPLPSPHRKAFTLTELIVVIAIIVLVLAFMVPVWNSIIGNRSVEAAQNQAAAFVSTVRADALYYHQPMGVCFYIDPVSQQTAMLEVTVVGTDSTTGNSYIDIATYGNVGTTTISTATALRDVELLSKGVSVGLYNSQSTALDQFVRTGVIMFDQYGQVYPTPIAITPTATINSVSYNLALYESIDVTSGPYDVKGAANTSIGMVFYDHQLYLTYAGSIGVASPDTDVYLQTLGQTAPSLNPEKNEEDAWIASNGTSVMINQFNGTFVQGK